MINLFEISSSVIKFTKETFFGKSFRYILFILFGLPFPLLQIINKIDIQGLLLHGETIPWVQVFPLICIGIVLSFFLSGYSVRILRGGNNPPDFDQWNLLFFEGIKRDIVLIVWFLPAIIFAFLLVLTSIKIVEIENFLILIPIVIISFIIGEIFSTIGSIRYARTGSIVEGLRYTEIIKIVRKIGWKNYLLALIFLAVVAGVFDIFQRLFSFLGITLTGISFAGGLVYIFLNPFLSVYGDRYLTLIYDFIDD